MLLDAVVDYMPSPSMPPVTGINTLTGEPDGSDDEHFSALAFKIMADPSEETGFYQSILWSVKNRILCI